MGDITNADHKQTKRDYVDFLIKNLGKYNDLYVQNDTLSLADVFNNFWNICLEILRVKHWSFFFCTRMNMTRNRKRDKTKIISINWHGHVIMLLMVEKNVRGGTCHVICRYTKTNNK